MQHTCCPCFFCCCLLLLSFLCCCCWWCCCDAAYCCCCWVSVYAATAAILSVVAAATGTTHYFAFAFDAVPSSYVCVVFALSQFFLPNFISRIPSVHPDSSSLDTNYAVINCEAEKPQTTICVCPQNWRSTHRSLKIGIAVPTVKSRSLQI